MIKLKSELINLKLVEIEDSEFIFNLRQDKELNKYISPTSENLSSQKKWIESYLEREKKQKEFYFIVQNKKEKPCGTVRIYNIDKTKRECTWGSFILDKSRPDKAASEVMRLTLEFIFEILELNKVLLDVYKENKKAIYIYEKSGFKKYKDDDKNYYYEKMKEDNH